MQDIENKPLAIAARIPKNMYLSGRVANYLVSHLILTCGRRLQAFRCSMHRQVFSMVAEHKNQDSNWWYTQKKLQKSSLV